jgi:hypothetical protein
MIKKGKPINSFDEIEIGDEIVVEIIGSNSIIAIVTKKNRNGTINFESDYKYIEEEDRFVKKQNNYSNISFVPYELKFYKSSEFISQSKDDKQELNRLYKHLAVNANNKAWFDELCMEG